MRDIQVVVHRTTGRSGVCWPLSTNVDYSLALTCSPTMMGDPIKHLKAERPLKSLKVVTFFTSSSHLFWAKISTVSFAKMLL